MRLQLLCLIGFASISWGQTTVYLRASGPKAVPIATVGTNGSVTTTLPHLFSGGDVIGVNGVCASDGSLPGQSLLNGIRRVCASPAPTTYGFSVCTLAGAAITATTGVNCDPVGGSPGASWVGKLTAYTLGSEPLGWFDGPTGQMMNKLAYTPTVGQVVVSGSVGSQVITVTTSFNPTTQTIPLVTGNSFSIQGTTSTALNTANTGSAYAPYTVASVNAGGWVSNPVNLTGVANGDYSLNNACGPSANDTTGGTNNCVRVSQVAYTGNPMWDGVIYMINSFLSGNTYKVYADGGTYAPDASANGELWNDWSYGAIIFLADPTNTQAAAISKYAFTNLEKGGGVNFTYNSSTTNYVITADNALGLSWVYAAWNQWASVGVVNTFLAKIYNDVWDPNAISSTIDADANTGHNKVLGSGTASAGGVNSITLAANPSCSGTSCVGTLVVATVGGNSSYGLITVYSSVTKVAAIGAGWSNGNPSNGTSYTVYATISVGNTAFGSGGATTTLTGYGTTFTSDISVGDAVMGSNGWNDPAVSQSYVSGITSDTIATVINSSSVTAGTSILNASMVWYFPKWKVGDIGAFSAANRWAGSMGAQPILYPPGGGDLTNTAYGPVIGSNNASPIAVARVLLDFLAAPNSSAAISDLAQQEGSLFDYTIQDRMNYDTGPAYSGDNYNFFNPLVWPQLAATIIKQAIPTFPSLDMTGAWVTSVPMWKMYSVLPDWRYNAGYAGQAIWPVRIGSNNGNNNIAYRTPKLLLDQTFVWAPTDDKAKYFRNWLTSTSGKSWNLWGYYGQYNSTAAPSLLMNDPRVGNSAYTAQPKQYLFQATSAATCAGVSGWACSATYRGDAVVSRTGWSSLSDTHVYYGSRTMSGDYDQPEMGTLRIYKTGELLYPDYNPLGDCGGGSCDETTMGDMLQIGGSNSNVIKGLVASGTPGEAPITSWSSANHGSWNSAYGDQNSNYACATSNLAPAYALSANITYALRTFCDSKQSSGDQFIFQWDTTALSSPNSIVTHFHYPQISSGVTAYTPGASTLNTGTMTEVESGISDGNGLDPTPNYGLMTQWTSPSSVTLQDDGTTWSGNSGACGGNACTHRISVCAGGSCGGNASIFELLTVHKIMQSLSDTTFSATPLNPDANWSGAVACGHLSCSFFLGARGGMTQGNITDFTVSNGGQWIITGLTPGVYNVTIGGIAVSGSPFTTTSGDNSIEFTVGIGGVVHVSTSLAPCSITTTSLPNGKVGVGYSQLISINNCMLSANWSISAGTLCNGLTLTNQPPTGLSQGMYGKVSGTPTTTQTCAFTAQVMDYNTNIATQPFTITIDPAPLSGVGANESGNAVVAGAAVLQ